MGRSKWFTTKNENERYESATTVTTPAQKSTVLRVASLRAAHQLLDIPLVFEDSLAVKILGTAGEKSLRDNLSQYGTPILKGLRTSVVVRSRMAEDEWSRAKQRGVRQYVLLGAGLDTFAYRDQGTQSSRIFEVDLQATQQWKRELLHSAGIAEPASLEFVPVDFESFGLAVALGRTSFRNDEPAFFSWLGVTMYLDEGAVMHTLRFIASHAPGSGVLFDYAVQPTLLSPRERRSLELISTKTAERGEPWKAFFDPSILTGSLRSMGFNEVEDFGPEQINARYLSGREDGLRKSGVSRLILARV